MAKENKSKLEPNRSKVRRTLADDDQQSLHFQFPDDYIDPILAATHRVWHVRDTKGNGSGPLKGGELRRKLDSGLIPANYEVCREDWEDWQKAADVFPELGKVDSRIPLASDSVFTDPNYKIDRPLTAKTQRESKKKQNLALGIAALLIALLITIGLCYLLAKLV